jgi:hypothetical protein
MSEERANAALARLSRISTEMAARRELRDRAADAARAASKESMLKIGPVAEKVAEHLGELGRRQREAGGWATNKTMADKENLLGFGPEEDTGEHPLPGYVTPSTSGDHEEDTIGALAEEDEHPEPKPPVRVAEPAPAAEFKGDLFTPRGGGRRRAPDAEDDDFSNTSSWLES